MASILARTTRLRIQLLYMNIIIGSCAEVCNRSQLSPDWLFKRVRPDNSIRLFLPPPFLDTMGATLKAIKKSDVSIYERVRSNISRGVRKLYSGSMPVRPSMQTMWSVIRDGEHILVLYAMTEGLWVLTIFEGSRHIPLSRPALLLQRYRITHSSNSSKVRVGLVCCMQL